jgi:hypothetical protein
MARGSKLSRAQRRARLRAGGERRTSFVWMAATAAIVVIGGLLIVLTVSGRDESDAAPRIGDHWHAYFGINACGTWLGPAPEFENPVGSATLRAGVHSHGDGLIHIHPYSSSESGPRATVGTFMRYGGWDLSETSVTGWDGVARRNGDSCPQGPGVVQWKVGRFGKPWPAKARTGNPASYRPRNGDIVAVYFLPEGAKLEKPPDAESALGAISDIGGQPVEGPTPTTGGGVPVPASPPDAPDPTGTQPAGEPPPTPAP